MSQARVFITLPSYWKTCGPDPAYTRMVDNNKFI